MKARLLVLLTVAAGTVLAAAVSALQHRSRARAFAGHAGTLDTFRGRLALGLSSLAVAVGMLAAGFAPGGWLGSESGKPRSWPNNALTDLSVRLGFQDWTLVPLTGLGLALVGFIGLVVCWAAASPAATANGKPGAAPGADLM